MNRQTRLKILPSCEGGNNRNISDLVLVHSVIYCSFLGEDRLRSHSVSSSSTLTQDEDAYDDLSPHRAGDLDVLSKSATPATSTGDERSPEVDTVAMTDCKSEEGKFLGFYHPCTKHDWILSSSLPMILVEECRNSACDERLQGSHLHWKS